MKDKPIYEQFDINMATDASDTLSADSESALSVDDVTINFSDYATVDDTIDISSTTFGNYTTIDTTTHNEISIRREGKQPIKVAETLEKIMERLSIIEPDFDKMERYPALQEAYNNYRAIEALLTDTSHDGKS